jgi:transaldolase/glucose-6-phosphate isomerase
VQTIGHSPLASLQDYGQSVWLDYIRRSLITGGELRRLIEKDGLRGLTSNPSIFEKAIVGSSDYTDLLVAEDSRHLDAQTLYERLAVRDVRDAADLLRPVYDHSQKRDGYVSLEVSPRVARDTRGTLEEARRLWKTVNRPNVMIKVVATAEGIPAIEQLIAERINVNVTLLFSQMAYERVVGAYLTGLEQCASSSGSLHSIASVASFFISRIDTAVDALLTARLKTATTAHEQLVLRNLMGQVAIANAKLTYQRYRECFSSPRWNRLAARGAQTQRLLWASTSTKNPQYPDTRYVDELIGPDTVNTIPPTTLDACRDHGRPRASLMEHLEEAHDTIEVLAGMDISLHRVADALLDDGVKLFEDAFNKILMAVGNRSQGPWSARSHRLTWTLPDRLRDAVNRSLEDWNTNGKVQKLWRREASLWTGTDESQWLGWLGVTNDQVAHLEHLQRLADDVKSAGFTHVLLLGMGGSSLCAEVIAQTFRVIKGYPTLQVLDSTDPAQIRTCGDAIDLAHTLFIVSSKSGATLEPNILTQYFFERVQQVVGRTEAGKRFVALTDPASLLHQVAVRDQFRHIVFGWPSIGGRYSALSDFGMVPAAVMGVDVRQLLDRTEEMVYACTPSIPVEENPGVVLGTILGMAHNHGRDKLTLVMSSGIRGLGAWIEQLIAESTGKEGKGIIPLDREALGRPETYGDDRLFVYVRLEAVPDSGQDAAVDMLERAGHPVVRIAVPEVYDLGKEFFRWELATAVAGSIMGIHPFNQPDVETSKVATRELTAGYEQTGRLPPETPIFQDSGLLVFTNDVNTAALTGSIATPSSLAGYLKAHLNRLQAGDYFAVLAYLERNSLHERALQAIRHRVRDHKRVATCVGFGPRFLHSTGQVYKGGPNRGVFLQVTCDDARDVSVPGQKYTFGIVKAAQARGDFQVLVDRGRRAVRVHLGHNVRAGLERLNAAIREALA